MASQITSVTQSAKAYVALVGSIATALLGVFAADSTVGQVLVVVVALATALGTYKVPNADAPEDEVFDPTDYDDDNFVDSDETAPPQDTAATE